MPSRKPPIRKTRPPLPSDGGGTWIYGLHPVAFAWRNPARICHRLLVTPSALAALGDALQAAQQADLTRPAPELCDRETIDRLLAPDAVHQGAALSVAPLPELALETFLAATPAADIILVLDQVTDPHNVGAILRSAAAFGAGAVIVTDRHAPNATAALAKAASGALEAVPLIRVTNLVRGLADLKQAGFWCVGLAETGHHTLAELDLSGKTALVVGAEGAGLRRLTAERCDYLARLPTTGPVATLNVSNAAAIALYEKAKRRG